MKAKPKKISTYLVTGGAGFIGRHLTNLLLKKKFGVRVLDNFITGSREKLHPDADIIEGDACKPETVKKVLEGCSGVFHLPAIPSVKIGQADTLRVLQSREMALLNVLNESLKQPEIKRIVFASVVFGN